MSSRRLRSVKATFNPDLFNPVFWHIWDALQDPNIRKILVRGGAGAGKTFSICDAFNLQQLSQVTNVFALRKHRIHVDGTIKKSFETSINRLEGLKDYYRKMDGEIRVSTGAITTYAGLDDPEKVKGIESYDILYFNELNQFDATEYAEGERRMRGRPNQKIVADWNPISKLHWINTDILNEEEGWTDLPLSLPQYEDDPDLSAFTTLTAGYAFKRINKTGDTLWINVTYRDNYWIVGHPANIFPAVPGTVAYQDANPAKPVTLKEGMFVAPDGNLYGFVDKHTLANFEKMKLKKPNDYRIYGLGEDGIIRPTGPLWKQFEEDNHSRPLKFDPLFPIHITADNNVNPYVTNGIWQIVPCGTITEIRQIWEVAARTPDNTAFKAAMKVCDYLDRIEYDNVLYVYGDPSANAKSTVDDEGRSFFDKYIGTLEKRGYKVVNRVQKAPPAVALSCSFINDIYENLFDPWRIVINTDCRVSLEDYAMIQEDPNGGPLKAKVLDPTDPDKKRRIEMYGHFTDSKRYFIITILFDRFIKYKQRSGRPRATAVQE